MGVVKNLNDKVKITAKFRMKTYVLRKIKERGGEKNKKNVHNVQPCNTTVKDDLPYKNSEQLKKKKKPYKNLRLLIVFLNFYICLSIYIHIY